MKYLILIFFVFSCVSKETKKKIAIADSIDRAKDSLSLIRKVKQDSINRINERLEKERQKCEKWYIGNYVDDFDDPTGEKFIGFKTSGSFSNSATSNSNLNVKVLVDNNDFGIELMEYSDNPVTYFYSEPIIKVKSSYGNVTEFRGRINQQIARLYIRNDDYPEMIRLFRYSSGDVKFVIKESKGASEYNFSISADCFSKRYNSL